jgi:hypothetical protein
MVWEAAFRQDIYYGFRYPTQDLKRLADNPRHGLFLPTLWWISKRTRDEVLAAYLRVHQFWFFNRYDNSNFRVMLGLIPNGYSHVRELHFEGFGYFHNQNHIGKMVEKNEDLELAVACTGLQTIRFVFKDNRHLCNEFFPARLLHVVKRKTVDELVREYHLRRLLDCRKLVEIQIYNVYRQIEVVQDLADWIRSEFAKKGQRVQCFAV